MIDSQSTLTEYLQQDVLRLLFMGAVFGAIGWVLGFPLSGLAIALLLFLTLQMRAVYRLYIWLRYTPHEDPPVLKGVWAALLYNIQRIQLKEKVAKERLLNVISRAQASLSALEEAIVLIDAQSLLEWWNPAAEKMLGFKMGDQGRNICNLIRTPEFLTYYQQAVYNSSTRLQSWIDVSKQLECKLTRFGENNRLLFVQDVTRLHQLEMMRKDFVANVSHELKTPLTVLSGYLENFSMQDNMNEAWLPAISQMQQQSQRMNLLINDLLHLSQLESQEYISKGVLVDMDALLHRLVDDATALNKKTHHLLSLHIDSAHCLWGAESELASAFSNLISNAIKYTPSGGEISISWQIVDEQGVFSVADNGIGIDSKHLSRLTERFYRVDKGRSLETGGTGLGLAIVKHVLMRHQARLEIASTPNKGSTFSCIFPPSHVVLKGSDH